MRVNLFSKLSEDKKELWFVADVGGTNCNFGLVSVLPEGGQTRVVLHAEAVQDSHEVEDFVATTQNALDGIRRELGELPLSGVCISGAGPVKNGVCRMTNQAWSIDGPALQAQFGLPVRVINDFTALCYGLPLLDLDDTTQAVPLPRTNGCHAQPLHAVKAALGAGTGLGVGFIAPVGRLWTAFPSEGGHMDFSDFDQETRELKKFVQESIDLVPEYEMFVSGAGIRTLFYFYVETQRLDKNDPVAQEIFLLPDLEKPAAISRLATGHKILTRLMQTFVRMYARVAANVATMVLPEGGLFLAGGIAAKNRVFFEGDQLFMKTFEQHCNPNIYRTLEHIPVYISLDYSLSLRGAAYAGYCLRENG